MRYVVVRGKPTALASVLIAARSRRLSSVSTSSPRLRALMGRVDSRPASSLAASLCDSTRGFTCACIGGAFLDKSRYAQIVQFRAGQNRHTACRDFLTWHRAGPGCQALTAGAPEV